jgi:hypothetical protein
MAKRRKKAKATKSRRRAAPRRKASRRKAKNTGFFSRLFGP